MIIVDLNQVMISNLLMQIGKYTNAPLEESMVRHMVLNSLRSYNSKFRDEYGEMIIACDNKNYWRKKLFPITRQIVRKIFKNLNLTGMQSLKQ